MKNNMHIEYDSPIVFGSKICEITTKSNVES